MGDAGHGEVAITLDKEQGVVRVEGSQQLTRTWVQLLAAIDQRNAAGQQTRLVSYSGAQPERVKKALSVLNTGELTDARQPAATVLVQRSRPIRIAQRAPAIDQQFAQNDNVPLQQPGVVQPGAVQPGNAQPPVAQPGDQGPMGDETPGPDVEGQGLVGPVQIEFLEGLDVIVIRGNPRDVARVQEIIKDIERLSTETEPAIEIVQLKHIGSEVIGALLRQIYDQVLSARQGRVSINPLVKPNAILLIGREESVKTIVDLIQRLDQPVNPASQFQVFPLRHTSAADAQTTITEFFANRTGLGAKVLVTADVRSNSVIVQAAPRDLVEVSALLARLDTSTSEAVNELRIFPLQNSLAEELAPILQSAVEGDIGTTATSRRGQQGGGQFQQQGGQQQQQSGGSSPSRKSTTLRLMTLDAQGERRLRSGILTDVQVTADPRANALIVSAPAESMDLLAALIRQLDEMPTAESQIKVFTVQNADASSLVEMLRNLFGRTQNQGQGQGGLAALLGGQAQGENPLVRNLAAAGRQ
jgi:type II secretory pathway component GspD/PulD (secretin)